MPDCYLYGTYPIEESNVLMCEPSESFANNCTSAKMCLSFATSSIIVKAVECSYENSGYGSTIDFTNLAGIN